MRVKSYKSILILSITLLIVVLGLTLVMRSNRTHLDQEQAKFYVTQLSKISYDTIPRDTLINRKAAMKIADIIFSRECGRLRTNLLKPFDMYLINGYWFVYGPQSIKYLDYGPMMIINCYSGEIKIK